MSKQTRPGTSYENLKSADIGDLARHLMGDRVTVDKGGTLCMDCPNHSSASKRSLIIDLQKGLWNCFGCDVGGDALQLVEFVHHGVVTKGQKGPMPPSHLEARNWLADFLGLPQMGLESLSPEEIAERQQKSLIKERVFSALDEVTNFYSSLLTQNQEVLTWLNKNYAIGPKALDQFRVGYAGNGDLFKYLKGKGFTSEEILSTGAFVVIGKKVAPLFNQRVVFPYLQSNRTVYLIGRQTPWTPKKSWEECKYKKLQVHSPNHNWISEEICNDVLFNEDALKGNPTQIVVVEGVTDCIALATRGIPAISPATIKFKTEGLKRVLPQLKRFNEVFLCLDNEFSKVGEKAARETAIELRREGIPCRIATLPLDPEQVTSVGRLMGEFGLEPGQQTKESIRNFTEKQQIEVTRLLNDSKQDVNSFFLKGHTQKELLEVLKNAKDPVILSIEELPKSIAPNQLDRVLNPVLKEIASEPEISHGVYLQTLETHLDSGLNKQNLSRALKLTIQASASKTSNSLDIPSQQDLPGYEPIKPLDELMDLGEPIYTTTGKSLHLKSNQIFRVKTYISPKGDISKTVDRLTNFHIVIESETINDEGEMDFESPSIAPRVLDGWIEGKEFRRRFRISGEEWGSDSKLMTVITSAAGDLVDFEPRCSTEIRQIALEVSRNRPTHFVCTSFGFHSKHGFLSPTLAVKEGKVIPTASLNIAVQVSAGYSKARCLDLSPTTPEECAPLLDHIFTELINLQSHEITLPVLAHAFLGPALFGTNLVRYFSPYTLFLTGSSGEGKTELAKLAQNFWGEFPVKERLAGWGGTPEFNRQESARCVGGLWVIDDFKKGKIGFSQWPNALRVLMDYADYQARNRATPGASVVTGLPIKCALLVTGEDIPANETAVLARSLVLELQGKKETPLLNICNEWQDSYRQLPARFIAKIQLLDQKALLSRIRSIKRNWETYLRDKGSNTDNAARLCNNIALNQLAFELLCEFAQEESPKLSNSLNELKAKHFEILKGLLLRMIGLVEQVKPGRLVLDGIRNLLASGQVMLAKNWVEANWPNTKPIIGYHNQQKREVYLIPGAVMAAFRDFHRRGEDEVFPYSSAAVGRQLIADGIIKFHDAGLTTKKVWIPKQGTGRQSINAWVIPESMLEIESGGGQ